MSAGGLLEIPASILALSAVGDAYDRACLIWKTIASARDFGDSVANAMSKLEMEFFRFQAWWMALENLARSPGHGTSISHSPSTLPTSQLTVHLQTNLGSPVILAASNIQRLLEESEEVLKKNGALSVAIASSTTSNQSATSGRDPENLESKSAMRRQTQKQFVQDLQRKTPWFKRLKHDATPWRDSDKTKLDGILTDMEYWNDSLYCMFPTKIRDSVLEQGLAGYLLINPDNAKAVSSNAAEKTPALSETARLLVLRQQTSKATRSGENKSLEKVIPERECSEHFDILPEVFNGQAPFNILDFRDESGERRVLVEWYPYPKSQEGVTSAWELARERISRLSYLLTESNKPETLHTLNSIGYVDNSRASCFGLVSPIPPWASPAKGTVSLSNLLSRNVVSPASSTAQGHALLPRLSERFNLAALMASSLYTFRLTRWYHKRFNSTHVTFMYANDTNQGPRLPDLSNPYVGGFVVSRPDDPAGISLQVNPTNAELGIYFHPSCRVAPPAQVPPFRTAFDIYSFGLMLAEIGFWNTMHKIVPQYKKITPEEFREAVITKCTNDLACWMGNRYREVTLRCLRAEQIDAGGVGEELNNFYWDVVLELIKCVPED